MDWMIVHFTLSLFLFQAADSKIPKSLDKLQEILKESEYVNITLLNTLQETILERYQSNFKNEKADFVIGFYGHLKALLRMKLSTSKQHMKMIGRIEDLRDSIMDSLKEENHLFGELNPEENMGIEDFFRLGVRDQLLQEEYTTCLVQLKMLKPKIYRWYGQHGGTFGTKINDDIERILLTFVDGKNTPEISLDDVNYEDLPPPFDDKTGTDLLERLQRIVLTVNDQLYEMPKLENEDGDDVKSEKIHSKKVFSEEAPRWLHTEKDIEEIRIRYIKWTSMLELENSQEMANLREKIKKNGFSIKFFIKTLAEYYNMTTMFVECSLKDDAECLEMVHIIFNEERFEKLLVIFKEWKGFDLKSF